MGKTIRFNDDDYDDYDRKAVKAARKMERRNKRKNKESFIDSGLNDKGDGE